ncbi:hypothetical protein PGB90_009075 [Kerria lacca]
MTNIKYEFSLGLKPSDSSKNSLLIIGNIKLLKTIQYEHLKNKLEPVVTKEVFDLAVNNLHPNPSDICSLYVNLISIAGFSDNATHYNSSAQPHLLTKIIKSLSGGQNHNIVIVCEKKNVFASGCAIVRSFPTFSRKTSLNGDEPINYEKSIINVEFLVLDNNEVLNFLNPNFSFNEHPEMLKISETLECTAYGIQLTARIVDTPCNEMNVDDFIKEIKQVGEMLEIVPVIIRGEELKERGFGGIYGVGNAAVVPPALVILSHIVPNATDTIAWVGKGIVYDTGGLCIKGRTSMPGMKRDCGGAAAILGAFYTTIKRGFNQNLHAVFCLAENAVGPQATKPDDIHTLYSGRTVEINNTDAEGRLVLADGVAYAQMNLKANIILDMATLTGAQSVSTGKYHAAVMSNYQKWEQLAVQAGLKGGDLAFPIPYCPELYFNEFTSAVADMKNSSADRTNALSSCAGLFIAAHLGFDTKICWIHVDIAGVSYLGERATGYGVALLTVMFGYLSKDEHLQFLCPYKKNNTCDSLPSKKMRTS